MASLDLIRGRPSLIFHRSILKALLEEKKLLEKSPLLKKSFPPEKHSRNKPYQKNVALHF